jgi:flagellar motor switch protein FliN/FliY
MARKPTVKNEITEDPIASSNLDLENAIDDLRGALKADEEGTVLPVDLDAFGAEASAPAFDADMFGAETSTSSFGDFGSDLGSDLGSNDFGGGFADVAAPSMMASAGASEAEDYGLDSNQALIMDIPIDVQIVLGSSRMPVKGLMNLKEGTTITLDKKIGEPVDITVNGRLIARGEITLLADDDTRFGVKLTELSGASKG